MIHHTSLWTILEPSCANCSNSITNQLSVHQRPSERCWQLTLKYGPANICLDTKNCVWYRKVFMELSKNKFLLHRRLYSGFNVAMEYAFIYVFVGPNTCHIFFFNTSLHLYKMGLVHYITCKVLLLSLPLITFLLVISLNPTISKNNCDLPTIKLPLRRLTVTLHILTLQFFTNDRNDWHILLTSPGLTACCSFSIDTRNDQASCGDRMPLLPAHS